MTSLQLRSLDTIAGLTNFDNQSCSLMSLPNDGIGDAVESARELIKRTRY